VRPQVAGTGSGGVCGRREQGWKASTYTGERATPGMGSGGTSSHRKRGRGAQGLLQGVGLGAGMGMPCAA